MCLRFILDTCSYSYPMTLADAIRPALDVAVIMRRERIVGPMSRWQTWRWILDDVLLYEPSFGEQPRLLYKNDSGQRWMHVRYSVELFPDDAEGYQLNITTAAPCWFVLWRMEEVPSTLPLRDVAALTHEFGTEGFAQPQAVSLSYHDAGRWLDAQETVEQIPAPPAVIEWLQAYVDEHYLPEPKRRKRPESFKTLTDRFGNPASVSTDKPRGGGRG